MSDTFNNVIFDSLYRVRDDDERRMFGKHYASDGKRYEYGKERLVARYPKDPPDGDGQAIDVYCTSMPARFWTAKVIAGPDSVGDMQPAYEVSTGLGDEVGELLAQLATEISRGMISFDPAKETA